jgi:hypothetical protein
MPPDACSPMNAENYGTKASRIKLRRKLNNFLNPASKSVFLFMGSSCHLPNALFACISTDFLDSQPMYSESFYEHEKKDAEAFPFIFMMFQSFHRFAHSTTMHNAAQLPRPFVINFLDLFARDFQP